MMNQKSCVHHWMIEPANGPISKGVCRMCNAERSFTNVVQLGDITDWSKIANGRAKREDGGD